jgi:hypothetical protein
MSWRRRPRAARAFRTREEGRRVGRRTNEIISGQEEEVGTEALRDTRRYMLISGES